MKKAFLIALASGLITAGVIKAAPALAEAPGGEAPINFSIVKTADLDLRSPSGQRALDQRLSNAAREVCGQASDVDLKGKNAIRKCRTETLGRVRAEQTGMLAAAERGAAIAVVASR